MIHSVLIFNNDGVPRLMKFYTPIDVKNQQLLLSKIYQLIITRSAKQCSFIELPSLPDLHIVYRHYATLFFVFLVDDKESELGILDLIQVFVEALNNCIHNVSELDLIFGWQVLETVLEEIIQGGMVIDTNMNNIMSAVDANNKQDSTASATLGSRIFGWK